MPDIIRISDYERRSASPDAVSPRDPADADVIILPVVRIERVVDEAECVLICGMFTRAGL
jgi:hypothetical protein